MFGFHRSFIKSSAATLLGFAFAVLAAGANGAVATDLQNSVSSYAAAGKYREASAAAFQLAEAHKRAGETAKSCAALTQSLEYYRKANAADERAASSLHDGSDGMAEVRAKFGCK
ncbi:MAG TPA: hypothetical protein VFJ70_06680 [Burkholderiales bacterium]|nr:hypothetical protein [Burkholderiales bacterium]